MKTISAIFFILFCCSIAIAHTVNMYEVPGGAKTIVEIVCENSKAYKLLIWTQDVESHYVIEWKEMILNTKCGKYSTDKGEK